MTKIYVSSTFADLSFHRDAVSRALRKLQVDVLGMEDYVASDTRPVDQCLEDIAKADLYLGIFAHRYGHVPVQSNPEQLAITEMEYRYAISHNKPCLVFLHDEDHEWPPKFIDSDSKHAKRIKALRQELAQELLVGKFTTPDNLAALVVPAIRHYEEITRRPTETGHTSWDISVPNLRRFLSDIEMKDSPAEKLSGFLTQLSNVLHLAQYIFIATTIRSHETLIIDEPRDYSKKVRPIKRILSERFTSPTPAVVHELAQHCIHVAKPTEPLELCAMREVFCSDFVLGPIGELFDELETILPRDRRRPRLVNKASIRKNLITYVLPEFNRHLSKWTNTGTEVSLAARITPTLLEASRRALDLVLEVLHPLLFQTFAVESIESVDSGNQRYTLVERSYRDRAIQRIKRIVSFEDLDHYEGDVPHILVTYKGLPTKLGLSPFITIKDDSLCFYRRTRAVGYEYQSVRHGNAHIERTKRKFIHSVFRLGRSGTQQALFYIQTIPAINESNGVRSNIPSEGPVHIFGRERQSQRIRQEILEIPNQNGIIYGVGGVGKTALLIKVTQELSRSDDPLFANIIWSLLKQPITIQF
jgi:hypothetical protein